MEERIDCSKSAMVKAFNEWMRRYIEEPERFQAEFRSVKSFEADEKAGREPSYGDDCTSYLQKILNEQVSLSEFLEVP